MLPAWLTDRTRRRFLFVLAAVLAFGALHAPSALVREDAQSGSHVVARSLRPALSPVSALGRTGKQNERRTPEDAGPSAISPPRLPQLPPDRRIADLPSDDQPSLENQGRALPVRGPPPPRAS